MSEALPVEELVSGPSVDVPQPIEHEEFALHRLETITDKRGRKHHVYLFSPEDIMPESLAVWLRYRSLTENFVATDHEGDKYRFKDVDEIKNKFLSDQEGRSLYAAVGKDNGRLYGITWIHPLTSEMDFLLYDVGAGYFKKNSKTPHQAALATIATREYGVAVRQDLALELNAFSTDHYFTTYPEFEGIIGRFGAKDNMSLELNERAEILPGEHKFEIVDSGAGWLILMALRENSEDVYQTFNSRPHKV